MVGCCGLPSWLMRGLDVGDGEGMVGGGVLVGDIVGEGEKDSVADVVGGGVSLTGVEVGDAVPGWFGVWLGVAVAAGGGGSVGVCDGGGVDAGVECDSREGDV
jgi:hypothetical protein